jgi:hypothetical protein
MGEKFCNYDDGPVETWIVGAEKSTVEKLVFLGKTKSGSRAVGRMPRLPAKRA